MAPPRVLANCIAAAMRLPDNFVLLDLTLQKNVIMLARAVTA